MPPLSASHIVLIAVMALIGGAVGWLIRARRGLLEKIAVNAGWHEQIESHKREQERLVDQNKHLMAQLNEARVSGQRSSERVTELTATLEQAVRKRDEMQLELQEVRNNLESHLVSLSGNDDTMNSALIDRDNKIFKLSRELNNWQQRLPPLIEKFRVRNAEAEKLEADLEEAWTRIAELESIADRDAPPANGSETPAGEAPAPPSGDSPDDLRDARTEPDDGNGVDDLQIIKGIGPAIEKTLNELGIFRVAQIAELSEYDIDRVASRLKGFRTRVYREDWIGQARELKYELPGSRS